MTSSLKCISLNCRGLNSYEKRIKLYEWAIDNDFDIICLQETHFVEENAFKYDARWRGLSFHSFSDSPHSRGVSILFRNTFSIESVHVHKDINGRRIMINFKYDDEIYSIVNIYAPNSEKARIDFFKRLKTWITQYTPNEGNKILVGDFNCTLSGNDRSTQTSYSVDRSARVLHELIEYLDLLDVWRDVNTHKPCFTWCDGDDKPKSRIDFVFISKHFNMKLDKLYTRKPPSVNKTRMSDHLAIKFIFTKNDFIRGSNYWKLNYSLVTDVDYCNVVRNMLSENPDELDTIIDKQKKWERVKLLIKNISVLYSKQKSLTIKQKIKKIEEEIESIETG